MWIAKILAVVAVLVLGGLVARMEMQRQAYDHAVATDTQNLDRMVEQAKQTYRK